MGMPAEFTSTLCDELLAPDCTWTLATLMAAALAVLAVLAAALWAAVAAAPPAATATAAATVMLLDLNTGGSLLFGFGVGALSRPVE